MKAIHIKAYTDNISQIEAIKAFMSALKIKFELSRDDDKPYDAEFVEKINASRKEADDGKVVKITLDDIWK